MILRTNIAWFPILVLVVGTVLLCLVLFVRQRGGGRSCPQCRADNPPHARFCRRCGTRV
ncbi:MAG TPA: zinc-ribbon domain-containing protein [Tepidisphaeraceae bacterium]|nr:zinc-ribbon domain-containing protein [Tepidisphaeraceae bacterium]